MMNQAKVINLRTSTEYRYWISGHAVERLRERAPQHAQIAEKIAAKVIDDRIAAALEAGKYNIVIDAEAPTEDTTIVPVTFGNGVELVAVMRMHAPSVRDGRRWIDGPGVRALACLTLITAEMAASARGTKWHVPNRPLAKLVAHPVPVQEVSPPPTTSKPKPELETPARGGTTLERFGFVRNLLTEREYSNSAVKDLLRREFGTAMSDKLINEVRDAVRATPKPVTSAVPKPTTTSSLVDHGVMTPTNTQPSASLAERLMLAIQAEATARESHRKAAAAALESAQRLEQLTAVVNELMTQVSAARGE